MKIYVRKSDNIIVAAESEDSVCPEGCVEQIVDSAPSLWTVDGYQYMEGDIVPTAKGREYIEKFKAGKIHKLWRTAKSYQENQLDANGLIGMQFKANSGGTKAAENVNWVQSIWGEYYSRKAMIQANPASDVSMDFSSLGSLPHNYYEAMNEEAGE
jgi:hypothetical protein